MKRRILAVLLSVMMAVAFMPCIAFAGTSDGLMQVTRPIEKCDKGDKKSGVSKDNYLKEITKDNSSLLKRDSYGYSYVNEVTAPSMISKGDISKYYMERPSDPEIVRTISRQFYLKKGIICVHGAMSSNGSNYAWSRFSVCYDESMSNEVDGHVFISEKDSDNGLDSVGYFIIPESGYYYLGVSTVYSIEDPDEDDWQGATEMSINLLINWYTQAKTGTKLKAGKVYGVRCNAGEARTFKVYPAKKGTLKVFTDDFTITKIKSSGGTLLGTQANKNYTPTFGVKKSKTYKLNVKTPSNANTGGYYIYVKNAKVVNKSGATKKKAVTLKKGVAKKGLITAGSTKAQWFKFKTTKKAKFKIIMKGATNNKYKFEFYKGSTKLKNLTTTFIYKNKSKSFTTSIKVPKGTYYVKITPVKKSSGWYSVKWTYK